ncbi:hypothetical protein EON62_06060, partial [archaeon]
MLLDCGLRKQWDQLFTNGVIVCHVNTSAMPALPPNVAPSSATPTIVATGAAGGVVVGGVAGTPGSMSSVAAPPPASLAVAAGGSFFGASTPTTTTATPSSATLTLGTAPGVSAGVAGPMAATPLFQSGGGGVLPVPPPLAPPAYGTTSLHRIAPVSVSSLGAMGAPDAVSVATVDADHSTPRATITSSFSTRSIASAPVSSSASVGAQPPSIAPVSNRVRASHSAQANTDAARPLPSVRAVQPSRSLPGTPVHSPVHASLPVSSTTGVAKPLVLRTAGLPEGVAAIALAVSRLDSCVLENHFPARPRAHTPTRPSSSRYEGSARSVLSLPTHIGSLSAQHAASSARSVVSSPDKPFNARGGDG